MISKRRCYPVDGSLESGPESKAQCFVSWVSHAACRPHWFTGGMRQLEVSIYCLKTKRTQHKSCQQKHYHFVPCAQQWQWGSCWQLHSCPQAPSSNAGSTNYMKRKKIKQVKNKTKANKKNTYIHKSKYEKNICKTESKLKHNDAIESCKVVIKWIRCECQS